MTRAPLVLALAAATFASLDAGCGSEVEPGSPTCDAYLDDEPTQEVTVTIRNQSGTVMFLGGEGCSSAIGLALAAPDGSGLSQRANGCGYTCEQLQQRSALCPADCAIPPVVRVDPGGSYQLSWSGTYVEPADMPGGCYFDASTSNLECQTRIVAPAGDYTLTASAWPEMTCSIDTCDCQPDESGSCVVEGFANVSGAAMQASVVVAYPSATSVDIVFQ